ncbi:YHS domain-containing protein [Propionibacterium cyclohexanicum]|uniref:YHS domain-containing protein n=1 Tax=Propionibacterium cyclohexanicum TaxID=64702 RepID=A0A1H9SGS7_9ACTN|nr:YHS domain-containing protein [Propionibacterium cyclohexanicum]SER84182.1 YHS domain-containing protein [Propionibacterium cyclohexanicum]
MSETVDNALVDTVEGRCPVCGREIPEGADITAEHDAQSYRLCSPECRTAFLEAPVRYVGNTAS